MRPDSIAPVARRRSARAATPGVALRSPRRSRAPPPPHARDRERRERPRGASAASPPSRGTGCAGGAHHLGCQASMGVVRLLAVAGCAAALALLRGVAGVAASSRPAAAAGPRYTPLTLVLARRRARPSRRCRRGGADARAAPRRAQPRAPASRSPQAVARSAPPASSPRASVATRAPGSRRARRQEAERHAALGARGGARQPRRRSRAPGCSPPRACPSSCSRSTRNRQWWTSGPLLAADQRVGFPGSGLVWEYYPGQGIEIQWLGTFGAANGLADQHRWPALAALLDEALGLAAVRGGGIAWEYDFAFDGGSPPWVSAITEGTAVEALRERRRRRSQDAAPPGGGTPGARDLRGRAARRRRARRRRPAPAT